MSIQIFYRAIAAKTDDGKLAFFTEDGSSNCWQTNWRGNWIRERNWNYRGTFASVEEFCDDLKVDKYEHDGYRAARGGMRNMFKRAAKKAVSPTMIMECKPTKIWWEEHKSHRVNINDFSEINMGTRYIQLDEYCADRLYEKIKTA